MFLKKITRLFATLIHLKPVQIYYQLYYRLQKNFFSVNRIHYKKDTSSFRCEKLIFNSFISKQSSFSPPRFSFLNKEVTFDRMDYIDWNFLGHGKLWAYNLNYFEFILSQNISFNDRVKLIDLYASDSFNRYIGMEPYPISLRTINWIKFIALYHNKIPNHVLYKVNHFLYKQCIVLTKKIEYHILANHLMENGFALLFAAFYFKDSRFYQTSTKILYKQLQEQILDDGVHYEMSPMYHQIILERLLDSYNLTKNNVLFHGQHYLTKQFKEKVELMLGWLNEHTFTSGAIPLFNDTCFNIAPSTSQLNNYAQNLVISSKYHHCLRLPGYRKYKGNNYELIIDVGNIGPDYQPGHAHADTFSFELYIDNKPVFVDTGISTYENNAIRLEERSTRSHNTVEVLASNQSDVWSSHRVGRRAKVKILEETKAFILAEHNGYKYTKHQRSFECTNNITIWDKLVLKRSIASKAFFHLHPNIEKFVIDHKNSKVVFQHFVLYFEGKEIEIKEANYFYAPEFNKRISAKCIVVNFTSALKTIITL